MTEKKPPTVRRFERLAFQPRFEYGEMAEFTETCSTADGTELVYEAENALVHCAIHPANWNASND